MNYDALKAQLAVDEGTRRYRYKDSRGFTTIGRGHNIDADPHYPYTLADEPLTDAQIDSLLNVDIAHAVAALDEYANYWRACPEPVQRVLVGLTFNLGWGGLSKFVDTLEAIHKGAYATAAGHLLSSKYAQQVGARADRYAEVLRNAGDL